MNFGTLIIGFFAGLFTAAAVGVSLVRNLGETARGEICEIPELGNLLCGLIGG
jgi:hypothetical protein